MKRSPSFDGGRTLPHSRFRGNPPPRGTEGYANDLLKSLQEGAREQNRDRIVRGFEPIEVVGWAQPPHSDSTTHRLTWAAIIRELGVPPDGDASVN